MKAQFKINNAQNHSIWMEVKQEERNNTMKLKFRVVKAIRVGDIAYKMTEEEKICKFGAYLLGRLFLRNEKKSILDSSSSKKEQKDFFKALSEEDGESQATTFLLKHGFIEEAKEEEYFKVGDSFAVAIWYKYTSDVTTVEYKIIEGFSGGEEIHFVHNCSILFRQDPYYTTNGKISCSEIIDIFNNQVGKGEKIIKCKKI